MDSENRYTAMMCAARYIDDIVARQQCDPLGTLEPGALVETWYHLTDTLFSTVVILDENAKVIERVSYDAYGTARHHHRDDLNGDGVVNVSDQLILQGAWGFYGVGDLNRDGIINTSDLIILLNEWGGALPAGQLSKTDNIIGYAGYIFNAEIHGSGLYTVRHRVYSPELGRWLTRDPIGYVDGMGFYEYVRSTPFLYYDPLGLHAAGDMTGFWQSKKDKEWEEMMRKNQELLKRKIENQRCRDLLTDEEADEIIRQMEKTLDDTIEQLDKIRHDLQREIVIEVVLTFVPMPGIHVTRVMPVVKRVVPTRSVTRRFPSNVQTNLVPGNPAPNIILPPVTRRRPGCFVAGTIVLAASGAFPIEDVQAGMEVWSYDHIAEQWELREVERTFEHEYFGDLVTLQLEFDDGTTDEITATGNHPFWVVDGEELADRPGVEKLPEDQQGLNPYGHSSGGRWTEARWLRLGDHFLTRTGKSATVSGLTIRIERVKVYNLQVTGLHLYAVGDQGVLVHNSRHRNSKDYKGPTWVYQIKTPGQPPRKNGITSVPPKNNVHTRPHKQLRDDEQYNILRTFDNRRDALTYEEFMIKWQTQTYHTLPGNIRHNQWPKP